MALPTLAAGAEVRLGPAHPCDVRFCVASQEITYTAASGERNAVRLTADPSGAVVIVDTGAAITVGPADASAVGARCTVSDDGHQARCTPVLPPVVSVAVGDADDTASIGVRGSIDGGPGDDVLDASADAVVLRGGAGSDRLTGGDGAQTLDGGPGPDTIAGGPGIDTATYADRGAPVHAALDGNPTSGEAGEGDAISPDVENLVGGSAADDLVGSPADNEIDGGLGGGDTISGREGNDALYLASSRAAVANGEIDPAPGQLEGGPGDDRLQGGSSADTLAGGPGNDRLDGGSVSQGAVVRPDGARDAVDCGTGQDTADPETDALRSCERLLTPLECDDPATCGPLRVRLTTGKTTLLSRRVAVVADDPEFPGGALSLRVPARVARRAAASRRRVVEHLPDVRDNATSPSLYPLTYRFFLRP